LWLQYLVIENNGYLCTNGHHTSIIARLNLTGLLIIKYKALWDWIPPFIYTNKPMCDRSAPTRRSLWWKNTRGCGSVIVSAHHSRPGVSRCANLRAWSGSLRAWLACTVWMRWGHVTVTWQQI